MRIVYFTHPSFLPSQSMPRFAKMLIDGMHARGHEVVVWQPQPFLFSLPLPKSLKKWLGYIDQYIISPVKIRKKVNQYSSNTIFVLTDNALGPWVPLVVHRPHIIHCHDFLAQRSALGKIPENPTSLTGRCYQSFIRAGYTKGKNFISVSQKTNYDLKELLPSVPFCSEVVYNGFNNRFIFTNADQARNLLSQKINFDIKNGYLLHVGGNQWYKNRIGLIDIYDAWRDSTMMRLPLLMIGVQPNSALKGRHLASSYKDDIYFLTDLSDDFVRLAYSGASIFIFPSLAEGFGWPIAEAMAMGCPVITTNEAPMTEVAGNAGIFIPARPGNPDDVFSWATQAAHIITEILSLSSEDREKIISKGLKNAKRFNSDQALNRIEEIYHQVLTA